LIEALSGGTPVLIEAEHERPHVESFDESMA
jgi:hypothetical protein